MDANGLKFWMLNRREDWPLAWCANRAYISGQTLFDPAGHIQTAQCAGISAGSPPAWQNAIAAITNDGSITWMNSGPLTWTANMVVAAGQYVIDSTGNLYAATAAVGDCKTGSSQPIWPTQVNQRVTDGNVTWLFTGPSQQALFYCSQTNRLQLRSVNKDVLPAEDYQTAKKLIEVTPWARDQYGNYARWDQASGHVVAGGSGKGEVPIYAPPVPVISGTNLPAVSDMVLGDDGILYIAVANNLVFVDRRERWPNFTLRVPDFNFWRLAAVRGGGVIALDRDTPQLGKVSGQPLPSGPAETPSAGILQPCQPSTTPPAVVARYALPKTKTFVALTAMDQGQFALLSWDSDSAANKKSELWTFSEAVGLSDPWQLTANYGTAQSGPQWPYAIGWTGVTKIAALVTEGKTALIFDLKDVSTDLVPTGDTFVLAAADVGPFAHSFDLPPYYASDGGLIPLLPLSLNSFERTSSMLPGNPAVFDSGSSLTVWHRMFLEGVIPSRCGVLVWLAASDIQSCLTASETLWYPHVFSAAEVSSLGEEYLPDVPRAMWQTVSPEVAFATPLLDEEPVPNQQGLFMVLVQRSGKAVRSLRGRYLGVRVQLNGDRRSTPEIAALRVYASRFSYVEHYLPEIYHEDTFGPDADQTAASTRRDFFERFVDIFENQLTRIEDRVANAYLLTRPESVPGDSIDWLGGWIGVDPDGYPPDRRRDRLQKIPDLYRQRGNVDGIRQALDVATNGMCSRGAVIVIEDFRLRHIFATILGADLSIKDDPLLPGYSGSSNSRVGDTLFLGDPRLQSELQALFAKNLNLPDGQAAAEALYDQLVHRLTIFVHDQVEKVDLMLVQRIAWARGNCRASGSARRTNRRHRNRMRLGEKN